MARMFEGSCGCGSQIYSEVEEEDIRCKKCGYVFVYSKQLKNRMEKGYCSNCGAVLFSKSQALPAVGASVRPNL